MAGVPYFTVDIPFYLIYLSRSFVVSSYLFLLIYSFTFVCFGHSQFFLVACFSFKYFLSIFFPPVFHVLLSSNRSHWVVSFFPLFLVRSVVFLIRSSSSFISSACSFLFVICRQFFSYQYISRLFLLVHSSSFVQLRCFFFLLVCFSFIIKR